MTGRRWCALGVLAVLGLGGCRQGAAAHLELARDAWATHDVERALSEYKQAVDLLERETSPESVLLRARALRGAADIYYLEKRDFRRAVEVYRELVAVAPEAPETLDGRIRLAELLRNQFRDLRGAIRELAQALQRNPPQGAELRYQVAKLYFELGDFRQSALESRAVRERFETSAWVDDALLLEGQALALDGSRAEARQAFEALMEQFPDSELKPHAQFELGKLLAEEGRLAQAIEVWVEALQRHPTPEAVRDFIARTRKRIVDTTPTVGREDAFDHTPSAERLKAVAEKAQQQKRTGPTRPQKSSVEAAGGSAEEAARDFGD